VENAFQRIGVIANTGKPDAEDVLARIATRATLHGMTLVTCDPTGGYLPNTERVAPEEFGSKIQALLACGGDGTLLSAVRALGNSMVPVMGINLGSLGFMTSVPGDDTERAVDAMATGDYTTSTRSMMTCRILRNGEQRTTTRALNDVVIGWGESSRVVTLTAYIDDTRITAYTCDGLIVSTPTGSTGHSLSAGGPILHPETPAFVLNVICPHTLSTRPLVVPDHSRLTIQVDQTAKKLILAIDGQENEPILEGDRIELERNPQPVQFLHLPGYDYFAVLRQKLGWRGGVT
jgi:NAD+ kinase